MKKNPFKKKPKRKALWMTAFPDQAAALRRNELDKLSRGLRRVRPSRKPKQKSHRKEDLEEYRRQAKAFITAAEADPDRRWCEVLSKIHQLEGGRRLELVSQVHHMRGRAGSLLLDQRFWLAVSATAHNWIHQNMEKARKYGWLCAKGLWNQPVKDSSK